VISALPEDDMSGALAVSTKITASGTAKTLVTSGSATVTADLVASGGYYSSSSVLKINGRSYTGYSNFAGFELPDGKTAYTLVVYGETTEADGSVKVNTGIVTNVYIVSDVSARTGIYGIAWMTGSVLDTGYTQYYVYTLDGYDTDFGFEILSSVQNDNPAVYAPLVVEIDVAADGTRSIENEAISTTETDKEVSYADSGLIISSGSAYYIGADTLVYDAAGAFATMPASEIQAGWEVSVYSIGTNGASNPAIAVIVTSD
jgi:hypothetical protein